MGVKRKQLNTVEMLNFSRAQKRKKNKNQPETGRETKKGTAAKLEAKSSDKVAKAAKIHESEHAMGKTGSSSDRPESHMTEKSELKEEPEVK